MSAHSAFKRASGLISAIFFCTIPAWSQGTDAYTPASAPDPAAAEDDVTEVPPASGAVYARLKYFEGTLSLKRESESTGEEAKLVVNSPLVPGDQIWTGEDGRTEIQLADGAILRLDRDSRVTLQNLPDREGSFDSTALLRLLNGSLYIRTDNFDPRSRRFQIDTPSGSIFLLSAGVFRVDVGPNGVSTVASYRGVAEMLSEDMSVMAHSGERVSSDPGHKPTEARAFNTLRRDPFDLWAEGRDESYAGAEAAQGAKPDVPEPVKPYVSELSSHGVWKWDPSYGWIWIPEEQESDWRPYYNGEWSYSPAGLNWVSYEPWGWAPYHYGRWQWAVGFGWFWIPGYVYSGAYVSWSVGPSYYGWCPLGYYDYPVYVGGYYPWTYVPYGSIYSPYVYRHAYSWSDVARYRMNQNSYGLRGQPTMRPGYRPEIAGAATYRKALANPRVAQTPGGYANPGHASFKDNDLSQYRRVAAHRASPEAGSAGGRQGFGPRVGSSPSAPGATGYRGSLSRGTSAPGAASGGRVVPISTRTGYATREPGGRVSPVTGRPMQPPVRVFPSTPARGANSRDGSVLEPGRPNDGGDASQRRQLVRGRQADPSAPPARVGNSTPGSSRPVTVTPHPRMNPGRGGRGSPAFVMPAHPPAGAPKGMSSAPGNSRPPQVSKSGGPPRGNSGGGGKKGGKN
jgi:uncharacterized protein DUF6600/FecR-like protein